MRGNVIFTNGAPHGDPSSVDTKAAIDVNTGDLYIFDGTWHIPSVAAGPVADIAALKALKPREGEIRQVLSFLPNVVHYIYNANSIKGEAPDDPSFTGKWVNTTATYNVSLSAGYDGGDKTPIWSIATSNTGLFQTNYDDITDLIDGSSANDIYFHNGTSVANEWFEVTFDKEKVIHQMQWSQANASSHGTWKMQGFNGTTWVDISAESTLGGAAESFINSTDTDNAYAKVRLLGVSGSVSSSPWLYELNFKVADKISTSTELSAKQEVFSGVYDLSGKDNNFFELTPTNNTSKVKIPAVKKLYVITNKAGGIYNFDVVQDDGVTVLFTIKKGETYVTGNTGSAYFFYKISESKTTSDVRVVGTHEANYDFTGTQTAYTVPVGDIDLNECDYIDLVFQDATGDNRVWPSKRFYTRDNTSWGYADLHYDSYVRLHIVKDQNKIYLDEHGRNVKLDYVAGYKIN